MKTIIYLHEKDSDVWGVYHKEEDELLSVGFTEDDALEQALFYKDEIGADSIEFIKVIA